MYLKCFNTNKGNLSLRTWPSHCKKKKNYNNVHNLNNTIIVLIMIVMLMKCGYLSWQVTIGCRCIGCRRMLPHEIFATFNFANYLRICKKDIKFPPHDCHQFQTHTFVISFSKLQNNRRSFYVVIVLIIKSSLFMSTRQL